MKIPIPLFFLAFVFTDSSEINAQNKATGVMNRPGKTELFVPAEDGVLLGTTAFLRMFIASSWFPRYNRSLNTCDPVFNAVNMLPATQKIFYGPKTFSSINLPVYTIQEK